MHQKTKLQIGNMGIVLVVTIPVLIWISMISIVDRFASLSLAMISLGQLLGLIGISLFSVTLILSARLRFLEPYFGGQNQVYTNHHYLGATTFILLIFHPLFLATKYLMISLANAAQFIAPWLQDDSVLYGSISLMLMIISLFFTFYKKLPYQIWKQTHRFMGLAFLFGGVHMFLIESDVSRNIFLRGYMMTLVSLGMAAVIYRVVLKKFLVRTYSYVVEDVKEPAPSVHEIILRPKNKPMSYKAGQFAFVSFKSGAISSEYHPFSVTSQPNNSRLSFTVKTLGDYTNRLGGLRKGDMAKIEGPFGMFTMDHSLNKKQIWIAGGIGITPFLSMARNINSVDTGYSIDLYYSVNTEDEFVYLNELKEIAKMSGRLRVFAIVANRDGYITADMINKNSDMNAEIFICGPLSMMQSLRKQFILKGVSSKNIHTEEFSFR